MVDAKLLARFKALRPIVAGWNELRDVLGRRDRVTADRAAAELARIEKAIARQIKSPLSVGEDEYLVPGVDGRLESISHLELVEIRQKEADQAAAALDARRRQREADQAEEKELSSYLRELGALAPADQAALEAELVAELGD